MDSTLLLYLLLREKLRTNSSTEIHCFTTTQVGTKFHSGEVLKLPEFFDQVVHHTDIANHPGEGVKPLIRYLLDSGWPVFIATNAIPLETIGGRLPFRPSSFDINLGIHTPFVFMFKYHLLDAYYKLGIQHLLKTTHSCTEQIYGECGKCFACLERAWAFNKLGKTYEPSATSAINLTKNPLA
jgi:hypothetical protein